MSTEEFRAKQRLYKREWLSRPGVRERVRRQTRARRPRYQEQERATQRANAAWRKAYLQALKLERGCADCGYAEHPEALSFDHLPGEPKSFNVGAYGNRLWATVLEEIEKCEVVCANCHAVRTAARRDRAQLKEAH